MKIQMFKYLLTSSGYWRFKRGVLNKCLKHVLKRLKKNIKPVFFGFFRSSLLLQMFKMCFKCIKHKKCFFIFFIYNGIFQIPIYSPQQKQPFTDQSLEELQTHIPSQWQWQTSEQGCQVPFELLPGPPVHHELAHVDNRDNYPFHCFI